MKEKFSVKVALFFYRPLFGLLLQLYGPWKTRHKERVPKEGGLLILANHLAYIDPPLMQCACPRRIYFMAKKELFDMGAIGKFMRWYGAFPVSQNSPDRAAIKHAVDLLHQGACVVMYPEGGTSLTGNLMPLYKGAALIVRMAGCNVQCCGLKHTDQMMPGDTRRLHKAKDTVEVNWGEPRLWDKNSPAEEILDWAESELRELTDQ